MGTLTKPVLDGALLDAGSFYGGRVLCVPRAQSQRGRVGRVQSAGVGWGGWRGEGNSSGRSEHCPRGSRLLFPLGSGSLLGCQEYNLGWDSCYFLVWAYHLQDEGIGLAQPSPVCYLRSLTGVLEGEAPRASPTFQTIAGSTPVLHLLRLPWPAKPGVSLLGGEGLAAYNAHRCCFVLTRSSGGSC